MHEIQVRRVEPKLDHSVTELNAGIPMNRLVLPLLTVLLLGLAHAADAGPFEEAAAAYDRHDYAAAVRLWRALVNEGNAKPQHRLGLGYAKGEGVTRDVAQAVKWIRLAADQGYADAQSSLGSYYLKGDVLRDATEAVKWFRLAANQQHARGQFFLALSYEWRSSGAGLRGGGEVVQALSGTGE
ncbi:MAG: sel1 repeat family protein [Betaproteobacteria bacterium]|nr:sel1 repeat family protein [Betaproteobacteria bacterium]